MITPPIIWTTLPNGFSPESLKFSIFVSPRLEAPGVRLDDFELGNWPERVRRMASQRLLRLQFGSADAPLVSATIDTSNLYEKFWDALFPGHTLVAPRVFQDHAARAIRSFSVSKLETFLDGLYASVANAAPDQFPNLKEPGPLNTFAQAIGVLGLRLERSGLLDSGPTKDTVGPPGPNPDAILLDQIGAEIAGVPTGEFFKAWRFFNRGNQQAFYDPISNTRKAQVDATGTRLPVIAADVPPRLATPNFDFHQVMACLGDHPLLLRMLGLIIDCTIDPRELRGFVASGQVRARVQWGPLYPAPTDKTPWTNYQLNSAGFFTQPGKGSDARNGLLLLADSSRFDVFQTDTNGNALKSFDYGLNMASRLQQLLRVPEGEEAPWVPVEAPAPESLPAQRNGGFSVTRRDRDARVFELLQNQRSLNSNIDDPGSSLYLEDVTRGYRIDVFAAGKWHSLCFRTGNYRFGDGLGIPPIVPKSADEGYVKAVSATSSADPHAPPNKDMYLHEALFGWDNWSLVAQRPGNSISYVHDDATRTQKLNIIKEPIQPPSEFPLFTDFRVLPGTLPKLRFGAVYKFRARVTDLAGNSLEFSEADYAAAPVTNSPELRYLRYEPLDTPVLVLRDPVTPGESIEHLVIRSKVSTDSIANESTIFNQQCRRFVAPAKTSQIMAELHGAFDAIWSDSAKTYDIAVKEQGSLNDPAPDVALIDEHGLEIAFPSGYSRGDALPALSYVIHKGVALSLPYLPDPISVGLALQGLPGAAPVVERSFTNLDNWPDYGAFAFTLVGTDASSPALDAAEFSRIAVPKGTILTLRYSSSITKDGLRVMARWRSLSDPAALEGRKNQHWMITPFRELKLVHAAEKPIRDPIIDVLRVSRGLGQTYAELNGFFSSHSYSTGKIDMQASWEDQLDPLHLPGPITDPRSAHVFERPLDYEESMTGFVKDQRNARHEFGDTKHRRIKYFPRGTTRYREYFPTAITSHPELITRDGPVYVRAGDVTGDPSKQDIPSSARPDKPKVLYVVPTFKWLENAAGSRTRQGRGLRIYLDRPWYSSGEGELLGFLLTPGAEASDALRQFVSEWGADPVFSSSGPKNPLKASDFSAMTGVLPTQGAGLSLSETHDDPAQLVDVIGFPPEYDPARKLWFVDVELNPGNSYFPFVRFALARFQPSSVANAHLSAIVRTEFAQLVADRTATIVHSGTQLEVTVVGPAARNALGASLPVRAGGPLTPPLASASKPSTAALAPTPIGNVNLPPVTGPGTPTDPVAILTRDEYAGAGRLVRAQIERLDNPSAPDLGWVPVDGGVVLPSYTSIFSAGIVIWRGNIALPRGLGSDGKAYRVLVQEFELFRTDRGLGESVPVLAPSDVEIRQRLVYTDYFPLSP